MRLVDQGNGPPSYLYFYPILLKDIANPLVEQQLLAYLLSTTVVKAVDQVSPAKGCVSTHIDRKRARTRFVISDRPTPVV